MNSIINIPQEAYDLIMGKTDAANLDLYSTLIQSVKNGIPLEQKGMTDYKKYINALRKCAKEHDNDMTFTGHIIVSDLCRDIANLLEELEKKEETDDKWKHKRS